MTTAPTTRDRNSELPKRTRTSPITASTIAKSVVHGRATIPTAAIAIPTAGDDNRLWRAPDRVERIRRQDSALAHRGDRRHARREQRRVHAGEDGDADADEQGVEDRVTLEEETAVRQREPDRVEQGEEPLGEPEAEQEADDRGDEADDEGLDRDGDHDLLT